VKVCWLPLQLDVGMLVVGPYSSLTVIYIKLFNYKIKKYLNSIQRAISQCNSILKSITNIFT